MEKFKKWLKNRLNGDQGYKLLHFMSRNVIAGFVIGLIYGRNLTKLAILNHTDKHKSGRHQYMTFYQTHLKKFKYKTIKLLEIGVGGYNRADRGGCSLRMWKRYFPYGKIFSIDIYDKFLGFVLSTIGEDLNIIIDDGSHINSHVIGSFEYLFPKLQSGGLYVVEDVQTSYREDYGGDSFNLDNQTTIMNFFKKLTDLINCEEFAIENLSKFQVAYAIESIHFYHNLIFIQKK